MTEKRERAFRILGDGKVEASNRRFALAVLAVFLVLAAAGGWVIMDLKNEVQALRAANGQELEEKEELLAGFDRYRSIRRTAESFPIGSLDIRKTDGVLYISGRITNMSDRPADDIELTVSFTDGAGELLAESTHTASSTDGKPLGKHQKRRFAINVVDPPAQASDIAVYITDIEFVDGKPWE
jgi:hypothetical protein